MNRFWTTTPTVNSLARAGLYLSIGLGLADLPTILYRAPEGRAEPPAPVLALLTLCGAITLIGVIIALVAGYRGGVHVVAISRLTSVLLGVPSAYSATVGDEVQTFAVYSVPMGVFAVVLLYLRPPGSREPRTPAAA